MSSLQTVFSPRDPDLLKLRDHVEDVRFVLGFRPDDATGVTIVEGEGTFEVGGLEVSIGRSDHAGTAYLVRAGGLTIFQLGLPGRFRQGGSLAWSSTLTGLREKVRDVHIAFLPLFVTRTDETQALDGFRDITASVQTQVAFPSAGSGAHRYLVREAAGRVSRRWRDTTADPAENRGDLFVLRPSGS